MSASGRGFNFWLILSIVMILLAPLALFEPYDWLQRGLTEEINRKPYEGDATIVIIDRETVESMSGKVWTQRALADLVAKLHEANADRIFIDSQRFNTEKSEGEGQLASVLAMLEQKAVWQIDLPSSRMSDLVDDKAPLDENANLKNPGNFPPDYITDFVEQSTFIYRQSPFGTPVYKPLTPTWRGRTFPSMSQIMAKSDEPIGLVSRWLGENPVIDTSYDVDSIPSVSAKDVLEGNFAPKTIQRRNIVIADLGERVFITQKSYTTRAAIAILGAQTILDGPQLQLYVWPALMLAIAVAFAWTVLPHPWGRWVAFFGFLSILLSPVFLEQHLIYQNTSQGLIFLIVFAIGRIVIRSREALKAYRGVAEDKSRFLAQASHDLRQPIHAIGLLAERLQQTELSNPQQDIVDKITWSTDHASRMFKSLLDLAILESGSLKPKMSDVPINDLLVEIDNQNAVIAEQAGIALRFVPSDATIRTDRAFANTILQNLVSNAIKYGVGGDILIGCRREGNRLSLCVYDQGPGISKKEVQLVSQEFYRGKKLDISKTDGVGLGLTIVRGMSDLLNLNFVLKSNPGKGTVAKISGFETAEKEQRQSFVPDEDNNKKLAGRRILTVDDDLETLQSTAGLLEMWGCDVTTSTAIDIDILPDFDIVLSDFDFGEGVTLADYRNEIIQMRNKGLKMVIVSGHHPNHIKEKLAGSDITILSKPLHPAELRSALTVELPSK